MGLRKFITDLYTGPDGEAWALGRVYTIPVMVTGLAIPIHGLWIGTPMQLSEVATGLLALSGAVGGMIAVTNHIDTPGGTIMGTPPQEPKP